MKILFILPTNMISGGNFVTYTQAQALQKRGHEVVVAFLPNDDSLEVKDYPSFELRTAHFSTLVETGEEFDVAFSTFWDCWYYLGDVRAKHLMSFVQSDERRFYEPITAPERALVEQTYRNCRIGIVTEAKWLQKLLADEMGHSRVMYAPNGIDLKLFSPDGPVKWPKPMSKVRILIEGPGGVRFKRVEEAFSAAFPLLSEIEVVFVSTDGVVEPGWRRIATHVVERASLMEMPSIYRSCDILLKLSSVEGFFGPPLEMMACGGTAVVTNVTGFDEYVRDRENALVVDIDNRDAAIKALQELVRDSNLRKKLSDGGLATAQNMAWESRTPLFEEAVLNLCKSSQPLSSEERFQLRLQRSYKHALALGMKHERQLSSFSRIKRALKPAQKILQLFS